MNWYLMAYPRSGVSWLRYIARIIGGLPAIDAHTIDDDNERFQKVHWLFEEEKDHSRGLVVIVRNYKEAIIRHNKDHEDCDQDFKFYKSLSLEASYPNISYLHPIHTYDNWPNDKFLIYYEDLVEKPEDTIRFIGNMMDLDVESFLVSYERHKRQSIELYSTLGNRSETGGEKVVHHSQHLDLYKQLEWDFHLAWNYPELYDTYLTRYSFGFQSPYTIKLS